MDSMAYSALLETPLGTMLALSSEEYLYGLYFSDQQLPKTLKKKGAVDLSRNPEIDFSSRQTAGEKRSVLGVREHCSPMSHKEIKNKNGGFERGLVIRAETAPPIESIRRELKCYFSGHLKRFETPIQLHGSTFQKRAWTALMEVPYGVTKSYAEQAISMGVPKSYRAVANANHVNPIAIVVPCHRIIRGNGELSGYAGGIARKHWLILNEQNH